MMLLRRRMVATGSRTLLFFCMVAALVLSSGSAWAFLHSDSNRVLVVYNSSWTADADGNGVQDSQQLAEYYAGFRGIPTAHLLGVDTRTAYYYDTHEHFYDQLVEPIKNKLTVLGPETIDVILLIYGIPYRTPLSSSGSICVDNVIMELDRVTTNNTLSGWKTNPYRETTPGFYTDREHFDHSLYKYSGSNIYLVCRLSAPNPPWGVINQLQQIRYADKYLNTNGYKGDVYVDNRYGPYTIGALSNDSAVTSGSYNQYASGDKNMAYAASYVSGSGLSLAWENNGGDHEIGESGAAYLVASNALMYGGWYNFGRYIDAFEWMPGSVGCDLNSDSASGMRSGRAWVGGAFQQGLSCGVGVIGEPYLNGHQRPNVLLYYLLKGYTFAEAAMLSTPYMEWQCSSLGDPLYTPLRDKPLVFDTVAPVMAADYPLVTNISQTNATIVFQIETNGVEPEVVNPVIRYGDTPECLFTNSSRKGYWIQNEFNLGELDSGSTYYYMLTLIDPAGHAITSSVQSFETQNGAPVAGFSPDSSTGSVPFTVTFDATASTDSDGSIVFWSWSFDDGGSTNGQIVQHTFTNPGLRSVSLQVTDDDGATDDASQLVRVDPSTGVMVLLQNGLDGFTNSADTYITRYSSSDLDKNFGARDYAMTFSSSRRALAQFDLADIPADAVIRQAELRLLCYQKNYGGGNDYWGAFLMTNVWIEGLQTGSTNGNGATWQDADRGRAWIVEGGDFSSNGMSLVNYTNIAAGEWIALDVASFVTNWLRRAAENYGVMLKSRDDDCLVNFRTKEWATAEERPMLLVIYESASEHTINVTATDGGMVSPSGNVAVADGADQSFVVSAADYHYVYAVTTNTGHIENSPFEAMTVSNMVYVCSNVVSSVGLHIAFGENLTTNDTPCWWLAQYGWTNNFKQAALADDDADGLAAWQEYVAGTDPTISGSVFRLDFEAEPIEGDPVVIHWPLSSNRIYELESTTDLMGQPFSHVVTTEGNCYTNYAATNYPSVFYRIKVVK